MLMKPITGYEEEYSVTDCGRVFSHHSNRFLKPATHKDVEYLHVSLWKNGFGSSFYVHRLIAITFIPNPFFLPEVNHKDGDRHNNSVSNLEWVTRKDNAIHAVSTGLRVYTNRMTNDEFLECLQDVIDGESYYSLSLRVPYQVPYLSVKLRRIAKEERFEDLLNQSLYKQKVMRARTNSAKNQ